MINYVVESNIDDRVLAKASQILRNGGLVCFPTESNWVVVADPYNKQGVDKLYRLRHVENTKHFTILCSSFQKAMEIALIDDGTFRLMKKVVPGPYTFILMAQKKIQKFLKASRYDHQVGIRFPPKELCQSLLSSHGEPVISSHLTPEMFDEEGIELIYSALIEDQFGGMIDMIIDPGELEFIGQTTIIDFTDGEPQVIREGCGKPDIFIR
ncbi:MAG TPA: L-threonylcarbamoyladenylate synthase [Bacteriovoracaceae bacterium]|nr:L-threonylcarbamoyladenylate synthase [Bacteriovoracaceae bacterium]